MLFIVTIFIRGGKMFKNFRGLLCIILLISILAPSVNTVNAESIANKTNNTVDEIDWSTIEDDQDFDWDNVSWEYVEIDPVVSEGEIIDEGIQPAVATLIPRIVIIGGKTVIKYGKKIFKKSPKSKAKSALKSFKTVNIKVPGKTIQLKRANMEHILTGHHPKYWTGKSKKTLFSPNWSIGTVKNAVRNVVSKKSSTVSKAMKNNLSVNVSAKYKGENVMVGISKEGRVKTAYPLRKK